MSLHTEVPQISAQFNDPDSSDITCISKDGVLFFFQRKFIEAHATGFAPSTIQTSLDEVVPLEETSTTLELLFQFMHPQRAQNLASLKLNVLASLAEASEKYQIFGAMELCRMQMSNTLPEHALEILIYAEKHDYPNLMDNVAPILLRSSLVDVMTSLPQHLMIPWIRYHEAWMSVLRAEGHLVVVEVCGQKLWKDEYTQTLRSLWGPVGVLTELETVAASLNETSWIRSWRIAVKERVEKIPKFGAFLRNELPITFTFFTRRVKRVSHFP